MLEQESIINHIISTVELKLPLPWYKLLRKKTIFLVIYQEILKDNTREKDMPQS